jgi:hypothetical protein
MTPNQIRTEILRIICARFVNLKTTTPRKDLVNKFEDFEILDELAKDGAIRLIDNTSYVPTPQAFANAGDEALLEFARDAAQIALFVLRNLYFLPADDNKNYLAAEFREQAHKLYDTETNSLDDNILRVGLYLAASMNVLCGWGMNSSRSEVISFQISERIVTIKDPQNEWNKFAHPIPANSSAPLEVDEADGKQQKISEPTRHDIVDALLLREEPFHGRLDLISFLKRVWPLNSMPSTDPRFDDVEGDIWQHMVRNNDWTTSELLYQHLDVGQISDEMFAKFLETCVHPLAIPETESIKELVDLFNDYLKHDGFIMRSTGRIGSRKTYKLEAILGKTDLSEPYEVVLSFAGEDRPFVKAVADVLETQDVKIFYDGYEEATLWGKDLYEHLHAVYSGSARFCVMYISVHYAQKMWPTHERRSAFEKALESKEEYILPARFDDTEIPGLRKTIGYVDLRKKQPEEVASLILQKLGRRLKKKD